MKNEASVGLGDKCGEIGSFAEKHYITKRSASISTKPGPDSGLVALKAYGFEADHAARRRKAEAKATVRRRRRMSSSH
jgi:hypothetical protein